MLSKKEQASLTDILLSDISVKDAESRLDQLMTGWPEEKQEEAAMLMLETYRPASTNKKMPPNQ